MIIWRELYFRKEIHQFIISISTENRWQLVTDREIIVLFRIKLKREEMLGEWSVFTWTITWTQTKNIHVKMWAERFLKLYITEMQPNIYASRICLVCFYHNSWFGYVNYFPSCTVLSILKLSLGVVAINLSWFNWLKNWSMRKLYHNFGGSSACGNA